jgi:hypothetical protein
VKTEKWSKLFTNLHALEDGRDGRLASVERNSLSSLKTLNGLKRGRANHDGFVFGGEELVFLDLASDALREISFKVLFGQFYVFTNI